MQFSGREELVAQILANYIQRRYTVLRHLPERRLDNITFAFELSGSIDPALLESAFESVVRRHDLLHARFVQQNDDVVLDLVHVKKELLQYEIKTNCPSPLNVLRQRAFEENRRNINLEEAPLFRACLLAINAARHFLILTFHHNIADAISVWIIVRDLGTIYSAMTAGKQLHLPDITGRYEKYATTERRELEDRGAAYMAWWADYLDGYRPPEVAPGTVKLGGVDALTAPLELETVEKLRRSPAVAGIGVGALLCCAYADALVKYGIGSNDLMVKNVVAGRNDLTRGLVGDFINLVPLRLRHSSDDFSARAKALRNALKSAETRQLPYWYLTEMLYPDRDLQTYGLTKIEYNVLRSYPPFWIDTPELRISFVAEAIPTPAFIGFEWCLNVRPPLLSDWELVLLYNTNAVNADVARNVLQEIRAGILHAAGPKL